MNTVSALKFLRPLVLTAVVLVAALFISWTVAYAGHAAPGTLLWANETINGGPGELLQYDIGTDAFVTSCGPSPTVDGRGVAVARWRPAFHVPQRAVARLGHDRA